MDKNRTYRVTLILSEPEADALARLAHADLRDVRTQAHFIVRSQLVSLGMVSPEVINPLMPYIQPAKAV